MSATKNYQSEAVIREMAARAFPERPVTDIRELTEGMCNVAYRLTFRDGGSAILKIAPADHRSIMRHERNMMQVEVRAMQLAANCPEAKAPQLYHADFTKTLCSSEYFLMETMSGVNFISLRDQMDDVTRSGIYRELGQTIRAMGNIAGEHFGILGENSFDSMYGFFCHLMADLLADTADAGVDYGVPHETILAQLEKDRHVFDDVTTPTLCHWDLWDGNVFVQDGHISGIIDWERTFWADPLMGDQFRRHEMRPALLEGYGQSAFSPAEKRRLAWYDLFLYGVMITEEVFREYEPGSQSGWVRPLFDAAWKELTQ